MALLAHWPKHQLPLDSASRAAALEAVKAAFAPTIASLQVDLGLDELFEHIYVPLACWVLEKKPSDRPLVLGINGAQGAGKASLFNILEVILGDGFGQRIVSLRVDDLYLTRSERERLAREVHPLFKTRGVPGTHDVSLGLELLEQLKTNQADQVVRIPVFDKSTDERCPVESWQEWVGPTDIIVFDGWCMGAKPQSEESLKDPVNELERQEDPNGVWRRYVNEHLATEYQMLFDQLDLLVMLKVPSMQSVYDWRTMQELKLEERAAFIYEDSRPADPLRIMNAVEISRFIAHYERLTCWMLEELSDRADLTLQLNENHKICDIQLRANDLAS